LSSLLRLLRAELEQVRDGPLLLAVENEQRMFIEKTSVGGDYLDG
jgi:hypothetical protein